MNNVEFLNSVERSFVEFVKVGTSRSTKKLVPLHGAIANDMHARLGEEYSIMSQGYRLGKEGTICGRYMDKKVDITIFRGRKPVGGVAVKFVMQNYSQNSNNYFENMLGETANIRSAKCPYFQVFIIPDKVPYYEKAGTFKHWESFTDNNIHKYRILDSDNPDVYYHTPNKTLIYVVKLPDIGEVSNREEYCGKYKSYFSVHGQSGFMNVAHPAQFDGSVILNDYDTFASKVYHTIKAL